ncbi:hypothetical protein BD413DRAFT_491923 [Trametes elegans]|nr:hypothetical protein BD413DRAFT_491923 [Trametes elegans]
MDKSQDSIYAPSQYAQSRSNASTALWGHLLRKTGASSQAPPSSATSTSTFGKHTPSIAPVDKAGASTRILLHDTQAHLENFTERVTRLTTGLDDAKRELIAVQKLYQDDHEQIMERVIALEANRCQTELQKTMGSPAQVPELREVTNDLSHLSIKIEALDKRVETLCAMMQDQQAQLLSALVPVVPLLQAVPLHVDNARSQVKEAVLELRQEVLSRAVLPHSVCFNHAESTQSSRRTHPSNLSYPGNSMSTPPARKKRCLETASGPQSSAAANASVSVTVSPCLPHVQPMEFVEEPCFDLGSNIEASPDIPLSLLSLRSSVNGPRTKSRGKRHTPTIPSRPVGSRSGVKSLKASASLRLAANSPHTPTYMLPSRSTPRLPPSTVTPGFSYPATAPRVGSPVLPVRFVPQAPASKTTSPVCLPPGVHARTSSSPTHTSASAAPRTPILPASAKPSTQTHVSPASKPGTDCLLTPRLAAPKGASSSSMPPLSEGKPMSLKDRRALLAEEQQRAESKRFILLDDEEDDDVDMLL